ncbi:leucine-rich repeat-containing protein 4-like isoform X1 [Octopus sinensis]|uniref:Leucine-rich repeat-containing protein 4-like isoform X1 n=1 Tax=Octopus sinensis TaxID=2607531 RepID=A0A6P7U7C7_9MOLL|nr:leucine-rich repeat-containing protein 4-like isoform X1 [Octopus sinensis]
MFQQLKLTFVLILSMSFSLESHATSDICSICSCDHSQTNIDCSSRGLTSIPQPIPPNVEYLNLAENDIQAINEKTFQNLSSLETLYLNGNNIDKIEIGTFDDLTRLTYLSLSSNDIKELKPDTFRNLSSLTSLYLSHNDIQAINEKTFQNLSSLKTL